MEIVLASGSPRRRRLLTGIVRKFSVRPAEVAERMLRAETFPAAAVRLAERKARAVAKRAKGAIAIGADTIAYSGKRMFRKTESEAAARKILRELSGKKHFVVTGVAVVFPDGKCVKYSVKASVRMKRLDGKLLEWYLRSGEWRGRAGCYDVSGKGRKLVESVRGEKETVVGLPIKRLRKLLLR